MRRVPILLNGTLFLPFEKYFKRSLKLWDSADKDFGTGHKTQRHNSVAGASVYIDFDIIDPFQSSFYAHFTELIISQK